MFLKAIALLVAPAAAAAAGTSNADTLLRGTPPSQNSDPLAPTSVAYNVDVATDAYIKDKDISYIVNMATDRSIKAVTRTPTSNKESLLIKKEEEMRITLNDSKRKLNTGWNFDDLTELEELDICGPHICK